MLTAARTMSHTILCPAHLSPGEGLSASPSAQARLYHLTDWRVHPSAHVQASVGMPLGDLGFPGELALEDLRMTFATNVSFAIK